MESLCFKEFDDKYGYENRHNHKCNMHCDGTACKLYESCKFGKNEKRLPLSKKQLNMVAYLGYPKV